MENSKPSTMGVRLKKLKDMPFSIITHMPFVMFRPFTKSHDGKEYAIMDYLYFYQDLVVSSPYSDGQYFDEMPPNDLLSFTAESFNKKVGLTVIKNTYYFNTALTSKKLYFQMAITQEIIDKYNKANKKNPIASGEYVHPETGLPMFFTDECEIVIPPPPPDAR